MKKTAILICLIFSLLVSCSKESKGLVIEKAENLLSDAPTAPVGYEYLEGVGSWLNAETEYKPASDEGIVCLTANDFGLSDGNLYFRLRKAESKKDETGYYYTSGKDAYAYISSQTGEKHFLCPDPLCTHGAYSGCQYLNLGSLLKSTSDPSILYTEKTEFSEQDDVFYPTIYEINTSAGTKTPIYTPDEKADNLHMIILDLMFEKDGKLYFIYNSRYEYVNDNGESEYDEKAKIMSLDLKTKQTEVINDNYPIRAGLMGEVWDKLLFGDSDINELYYTDYNFENSVTVLKYSDEYSLKNLYYDKNTDELYAFIMYSELAYPEKMDMSDNDIHCKVYKIDKDFNLTEIPMPSEMVTSIQLAKDYIYYTVYEPIQYGTRKGRPVLDTTGGKIYRVPRDNTTEGELFFDGKGELIFRGSYCVVGDNLYLRYYKYKGVADDASCYYTGSIARVNVKENTLKWINLY